MDLRKPFFAEMCKLAEDPKVMLLTGDLGYSFYEEYREKFPKQFLNMGIAEQNMVGVAVGMSYKGFKPYCYSNSIFLLSRANEFVRDDVAYNNANVKLIGTGAAGFLGFSHNLGPEESEQNLLKGVPNIKLFYPKDEVELAEEMRLDGPVFIRL
jgi:transketolase